MQTNIRTSGFTLIELMIAVVIVGILAAVALPSYNDSVRKTQRADAKIKLSETAQIMERCYTELNAYNNINCPNVAAGVPTIFSSFTSDEGYYTISGVIASDSFTLTATPVAGGPQAADAKCTTFVLTHTGAKTATGSDSANCW